MKLFKKIDKTKVLTVMAVVGVPISVGLGCWATAKSIRKNESYERDFYYKNQRTPKKYEAVIDKTFDSIPYYIPAIAATCLTMSTIIKIERLNLETKTALLAAGIATTNRFQKYKNAVIETSEELAHKVETSDLPEGCTPTGVYRRMREDSHSDEVLYFIDTFGTKWYATEAEEAWAMYSANRLMMQNCGDLSMGDLYSFRGVKPSTEMTDNDPDYGFYDKDLDELGYCYDYFAEAWEFAWVDCYYDEFEMQDGSKGYKVSYPVEPIYNFNNYPTF